MVRFATIKMNATSIDLQSVWQNNQKVNANRYWYQPVNHQIEWNDRRKRNNRKPKNAFERSKVPYVYWIRFITIEQFEINHCCLFSSFEVLIIQTMRLGTTPETGHTIHEAQHFHIFTLFKCSFTYLWNQFVESFLLSLNKCELFFQFCFCLIDW